MAISVTEDLRLGARALMTKDGDQLTRVLYVTGLTPGKDTLRCWGVQDPTSGARVPNWGEAHPTVAGCTVSNLDSVSFPANSNTSAKVTVTYTWPNAQWGGAQDTWVYRITGANRRQLLQFDPTTGFFLSVAYKSGTNTWVSPCLDVYGESTNTIVEVTHSEAPGLFAKNRQFRKRINSVPFWGQDPYTVVCRAIDGETIQNGTRVLARYFLEIADTPSDFLQKSVFTNDRGLTPEDVLQNANFLPTTADIWDNNIDAGQGHGQAKNGVRVIRPFKAADLNGLAIPTPPI